MQKTMLSGPVDKKEKECILTLDTCIFRVDRLRFHCEQSMGQPNQHASQHSGRVDCHLPFDRSQHVLLVMGAQSKSRHHVNARVSETWDKIG